MLLLAPKVHLILHEAQHVLSIVDDLFELRNEKRVTTTCDYNDKDWRCKFHDRVHLQCPELGIQWSIITQDSFIRDSFTEHRLLNTWD